MPGRGPARERDETLTTLGRHGLAPHRLRVRQLGVNVDVAYRRRFARAGACKALPCSADSDLALHRLRLANRAARVRLERLEVGARAGSVRVASARIHK
jgi:hypothetical protein